MRRSSWRTKAAWLLFAVLEVSSARAEDVKRACVTASTAGQTQRDEGKLLEAREQLLRCAREDCPGVVKSHCADWLSDIESQIPSIVVRVLDTGGNDRTDVRTTVDGKQLKLDGKPISLDPGEHVVSVETSEGQRKEQKVLIVVREKSRLLTIQIATKPLPEGSAAPAPELTDTSARPAQKAGAEVTEPSRIPLGAFVVGGIGVAALGSALYFGLTARSQYHELERDCAPRCNPADTDAAKQKAMISDVSLGIGAAAVVGGVVWAILGSGRRAAVQTPSARVGAVPVTGGWVATWSSSY